MSNVVVAAAGEVGDVEVITVGAGLVVKYFEWSGHGKLKPFSLTEGMISPNAFTGISSVI